MRFYLVDFRQKHVKEKRKFGGLAFRIDDKMCINVSVNRLICRFDPELQPELSLREAYRPMIMQGKQNKSFYYVEPEGYDTEDDFNFWVDLCLAYNKFVKSSKKR